MKAIFKLNHFPFEHGRYIKEEDAQTMYKNGNPTRHIPVGFYSKNLTFEEWLDFYKFKIL